MTHSKTEFKWTGNPLAATLSVMRQLTCTVLIEQDETGACIAKVPGLRGCYTHARSVPELLKRVHEAIMLCLEVEGKSAKPSRFVGVQQISVAR